jgi:hypothetical protein
MTDDRGTALIETVVLGFAILSLVLPTVLMTARMSEASSVALEEARGVATWVARHGTPPDQDHRSNITIDVIDGVVHVSASIEVDLVSIGGADLGTIVTSSFAMPISPYRSGR